MISEEILEQLDAMPGCAVADTGRVLVSQTPVYVEKDTVTGYLIAAGIFLAILFVLCVVSFLIMYTSKKEKLRDIFETIWKVTGIIFLLVLFASIAVSATEDLVREFTQIGYECEYRDCVTVVVDDNLTLEDKAFIVKNFDAVAETSVDITGQTVSSIFASGFSAQATITDGMDGVYILVWKTGYTEYVNSATEGE